MHGVFPFSRYHLLYLLGIQPKTSSILTPIPCSLSKVLRALPKCHARNLSDHAKIFCIFSFNLHLSHLLCGCFHFMQFDLSTFQQGVFQENISGWDWAKTIEYHKISQNPWHLETQRSYPSLKASISKALCETESVTINKTNFRRHVNPKILSTSVIIFMYYWLVLKWWIVRDQITSNNTID